MDKDLTKEEIIERIKKIKQEVFGYQPINKEESPLTH
jgi:hypothetical protein